MTFQLASNMRRQAWKYCCGRQGDTWYKQTCNPGMTEVYVDNDEDNEVKGTRLAISSTGA
jgi:hypothetical protein